MLREKGYKRETKHLNMLMFIKGNVWKVCVYDRFPIAEYLTPLCCIKTLFGREADRLEKSNDDKCSCEEKV